MKKSHVFYIVLYVLCLIFFVGCGGQDSSVDGDDNDMGDPVLTVSPEHIVAGTDTLITVTTEPSGYTLVASEVYNCIVLAEPSGDPVTFVISDKMASGLTCELTLTYAKGGQEFVLPLGLDVVD